MLEDRPIDRKFIVTLLTAAGHEVSDASDGDAGLELAARVHPDLIISDMLMPTVDGLEFVRRLRAIPALAHTPVIFYTATYHEREARALAAQCGVADVLTKPSEPKVILARVNSVLAAEIASPTAASTVPPDAGQFSRDHLRMVSTALASKVEHLEASEQRMAVLVDVAQQVAAERDPLAVVTIVCRAAREVTLAQHGIVGIVNDDGTFHRVATSGMDAELVRRISPAPVDTPVTSRVIADWQPMRFENPSGRPEDLGLPADQPETFSLLVVPIASPSRVYGCLALRNKLGADGFTDRDEDVAMTMATHAGIAYENAQLFEELRRAVEALRESDGRTHFALAAARMGVWELNLRSDQLTWSDTMAPIFGLTADRAPKTAEEFSRLIHPEDRRVVEDALRRTIAGRGPFSVEFRAVWPDGSARWVHGRATLATDAQGQPLRVLGVGMDIGDRKSLEQQLRQAQKMEAVGQLAGGVAHDFNNLLTAIRGYASLVQESFVETDERHGDIDEILKAADRAAALTRQLLAFSRKQLLQMETLDLNTLVTDTSRMLRRLIGEDIELVVTVSNEPAIVRTDAGQYEQILMNLAVNARDAMPGGGRLSIEVGGVIIDEAYPSWPVDVRPGPYVMVAVTDTGTGMDEQTKSHIFEPFFTTKERGRGTGLGLATVYGIVKQSNGYIWVYSEVGRGTTFKVYLPRAEGAAAAGVHRGDVPGPAPTGTETILVVEDEPPVRALARALLERAGYRVLDAANAADAEAVMRAHAGAIALLLADVILPGSSGPTLFERLAADYPRLKVLYTSGYTDNAFAHHTGLAIDAPFLQKPFTADGLLRKVREALDR